MKKSVETALRFLKDYRWNSVFIKYFKKFMLLIAVPFLVAGAFFYWYYSVNVKAELRNSAEKIITHIENKVGGVFVDSERQFFQILNDKNLMPFLLNEDMVFRGLETSRVIGSLTDKLNSFVSVVDYLNDIDIYSARNRFVLSTGQSAQVGQQQEYAPYLPYLERGQISYIYQNSERPDVLSIVSVVPYKDTALGCVAFYVDIELLDQMMMVDGEKGEEVYLVDESGYIVYATNREKIGQIAEGEGIRKAMANVGSIVEEERRFYKAKELIDGTMLLYKSELFQIEGDTAGVFVLLGLLAFVLLLPVLMAFYISMQSYTSIAAIVSQLQGTEEGKDGKREFNELAYINQNLLGLIKNNDRIEKELAEKMAEIRKLQSTALQMQISPHFLFNTLNLVSLMLMRINKGGSEVGNVIALLSDLLDYSLSSQEYIVNVTEELLYARKYLEICEIKYKDSFQVHWDVDESVKEYKTIKFILQPILENCFEHGIKLLEDKIGTIDLSAKVQDKKLIFTIRDDCGGMSRERLEEVRKNLLYDDMPQKRHIGIVNIHQRIRLICGERYGCEVDSDSSGTTVRIGLPLIAE